MGQGRPGRRHPGGLSHHRCRSPYKNPQRLLTLCLFGSPVRGSGTANADAIRRNGVRQWAAETMRARLGSSASDAQVSWWTDELMGKSNPRAALGASAARIDMDLEAALVHLGVPTLIVTTRESGLQSVAAVERYVARIPDARLIVLPGDSYHIAAVEPDVCETGADETVGAGNGKLVGVAEAGRPILDLFSLDAVPTLTRPIRGIVHLLSGKVKQRTGHGASDRVSWVVALLDSPCPHMVVGCACAPSLRGGV